MFRKKNYPDPRPWSKDPRVNLEIAEVSATRAIFQGKEEAPRITVTMTTTDHQIVDFDLSLAKAVKLLEQLTYSYRASATTPRTRTETHGL